MLLFSIINYKDVTMVAKYKEEVVLNIHNIWSEKSDDLDNILFKQNGISVKRLSVESCIHGAQSKIDVDALANFGTRLLNDQNTNQNYYSLLLPSQECFCGSHAVAMAVDNKNKTIYYHDSHGVDMRKEMKDFLGLLLPEYKIDINHSKQQEDVINPFVSEANDNSCVLLTKYNLRDMWHKITGQEDKICNYTSLEARKDAWNKLKDIQKEEIVQSAAPSKPAFKFGIKIVQSQEEIAAEKEAEKADFKYRLYNEPNYTDLLQNAVSKAKANHMAYCQQLMTQKIR